jgi:phosphoribosyl-AMP cyclohydrolase
MQAMFAEIEFDQQGLVPCVVQDFASGEVLMLAYMSGQSLEMTLETGDLHFYSRSRDELWKKGETSGNIMHLRQLRYDCDGDALVALVDPAGPTRRRPRASRTRSPSKRCQRWSGRSATAPCSDPRAATR